MKVYIKHGMTVDRVHEIVSFRQSKWLENYIIKFNTQNTNKATNDFVKDFYILLDDFFYGKRWKMLKLNEIRIY